MHHGRLLACLLARIVIGSRQDERHTQQHKNRQRLHPSYLFWVAADAVALGDLVALDVISVGCSFPVEVGPVLVPSPSAHRGGPAGLEAVGAVVDLHAPAR